MKLRIWDFDNYDKYLYIVKDTTDEGKPLTYEDVLHEPELMAMFDGIETADELANELDYITTATGEKLPLLLALRTAISDGAEMWFNAEFVADEDSEDEQDDDNTRRAV